MDSWIRQTNKLLLEYFGFKNIIILLGKTREIQIVEQCAALKILVQRGSFLSTSGKTGDAAMLIFIV
jgi:hypothetical protein